LVLEYVFNQEESTVTLVCDYAHDVVRAVLQRRKPRLIHGKEAYDRDLRKLIFSGLTGYQRENGSSKSLLVYRDRFFARDHVPSIVIETLRVTPSAWPGKFKSQISFVDFGRSTFSFTHFQVERKLVQSIGKRTDAEVWDYIDIITGQQVDFDDPFKTS
jgi:hypothetical protein